MSLTDDEVMEVLTEEGAPGEEGGGAAVAEAGGSSPAASVTGQQGDGPVLPGVMAMSVSGPLGDWAILNDPLGPQSSRPGDPSFATPASRSGDAVADDDLPDFSPDAGP